MTTGNGQTPPSRRLDTWKEIASYFGRDERTVRRWETSRRLPVYRVPGTSGGTVYAFESELAAWLRGNPENAPPKVVDETPSEKRDARSTLLWSSVAALLAGLVAFGIYWRTPAHNAGAMAPVATSHDAQATALYKSGLYEWQTRTPTGLTNAASDFQRAIARDPKYAAAYAGLANCYNLLREYTTMPAEVAYPRAKAAAERAIALNPNIGEAHAALAFDDFYWSRDLPSARREFLSALALEPDSAVIHHWYATFLMTIREFPQALSEIDKAEALDSASTAIRADKGLILFNAGKDEAAISLWRRLEQAEPNTFAPHAYLAGAYRADGEYKDYLREAVEANSFRHDENAEALVHASIVGFEAGGRDGMFKAVLALAKQLYAQGKIPSYFLAGAYADMGDEANTMNYLKLAVSRRDADTISMALERHWTNMRAKPEFQLLLARAGLASHA